MATLTKPYTFASGGYAVASQVNADFDTIYGWINGGGAMWNDGSVAFTGVPSGPSADPTSANQLARKSYVDGKVQANGGTAAKIVGGTAVIHITGGNSDTAISFTPVFPTTCVGVVCSNGDSTAASNLIIEANTVNTSSFKVAVHNNSGAGITGTVRVDYIAFGF